MLTIRLVDPRRDRMLWWAHVLGQHICYRPHGASGATHDYDPFSGRVWAVVLLDEEEVPVAGARIHARSREHPLPVEHPYGGSSLLRGDLDRRQGEGVGEVAGLWVAEALAGTGIGLSIVAACVAYAPLLRLRHLVALTHQPHHFHDDVGFARDERLGDHPWPDARNRSGIRWCDAMALRTAHPSLRHAILAHRRGLQRGEVLRMAPPVALGSRTAAAVA